MPEQAKPLAAVPHPLTGSAGKPTHDEIAALAYSLWQARGCPEGTPGEDWVNAEKALKARAEAWSFYH